MQMLNMRSKISTGSGSLPHLHLRVVSPTVAVAK